MVYERTAIIDFDDLCDTNDPFDDLMRLKERDDGFKVTLFAIPTRCSEKLLTKYMGQRHWIQLGIHGWRHARHECLAWTSEETQDKLRRTREIYSHFVPVFKAPNWELCDEVYTGCAASGFAVADHIRNIEILPDSLSHYIYNLKLRDDSLQRLHGHIQPWNNTGLTENAEGSKFGINRKYVLPRETRYGFVTEALSSSKDVEI